MEKNHFAIFGLGNFGSNAARVLHEFGKSVIAIDMDEEAVQAAADYSTQAVLADATDINVLRSLGIPDVDAAIVSLGSRMDVITLAALHIIELNIPHVVVKSLSEDHTKILRAIGVHEVIYPEKEMAIRTASRLARKDVLDFLPLVPGYSITEVITPPEFVGKSLKELALRNTLKVQLIAIERNRPKDKQNYDKDDLDINIVPHSDDVIEKDDVLVFIGKNKDLDRIASIVKQ